MAADIFMKRCGTDRCDIWLWLPSYCFSNLFLIGSEYDQEIPPSHTADQPTAYFYLILYVPVKILLTYVRLGLPASGLNHH